MPKRRLAPLDKDIFRFAHENQFSVTKELIEKATSTKVSEEFYVPLNDAVDSAALFFDRFGKSFNEPLCDEVWPPKKLRGRGEKPMRPFFDKWKAREYNAIEFWNCLDKENRRHLFGCFYAHNMAREGRDIARWRDLYYMDVCRGFKVLMGIEDFGRTEWEHMLKADSVIDSEEVELKAKRLHERKYPMTTSLLWLSELSEKHREYILKLY